MIGLAFEEGLRLAAAERDYPPPPVDLIGLVASRTGCCPNPFKDAFDYITLFQ